MKVSMLPIYSILMLLYLISIVVPILITFQDDIKETGSDILLPVSKGTQYVISQVINHLFGIISPNDHNQNPHTPAKPSYVTNSSLANDSFGSCYSSSVSQAIVNATVHPIISAAVNPIIKIQSPEPPMSPARYRSLDTLTSSGNDEIPEPGILRKDSPCKESLSALLNSSPVRRI